MAFFPQVPGPIPYEGPDSRNPLAFKHYDAGRMVGGKSMADHLRFAVCYWHTFQNTGADPFGAPTMQRPWHAASDPLRRAEDTLDAAFEFFHKLGVGFWCFHDLDLAPEGGDGAATARNLEHMVPLAKERQNTTGTRLLWGTANLFSNPLYQCGAATNPDPHVFARAAAQVKRAMEATLELGGLGYVFWGGREGYDTLLNTDLKREREQLAAFLHMAAAHADSIGFQGQLMLEPKPCEPSTHQYDSDVEACLNFLREFDLLPRFKLNIESNHATLAGHSMVYELQCARHAGALGSVDANVGDMLLGWDTDQFPTDPTQAAAILLEVLAMGGFTTGGLNFDAKVRRASHEPVDLFHGHIGGMDAFAIGLELAHAVVQDGRMGAAIQERYADWNCPFGTGVLQGQATLASCEAYMREHGEPKRRSGRQEMLENCMQSIIWKGGR